jgi:hypothetical protein
MINKTISYRPKLEGGFRTRFYDTASKINASISSAMFDEIIMGEVVWAENDDLPNTEQRRKYRAVWLLLRDLVRASWTACYHNGILELSLPTLDFESISALNAKDEKEKLRSWLSESRLERLYTFENLFFTAPRTGGAEK